MKKKRSIISKYLSKIGRKGGLARSESKAEAVRENGKLGGRPRKPSQTRVERDIIEAPRR